MTESISGRLNGLRLWGIGIAVIGAVGCIVGVLGNSRQFYISYLVAWTFWIGLSLGCLGVTMLHHLTGGRWGFVTRRMLEAGYLTLPMMLLLFVPVFLGRHVLYPWNSPGIVTDELSHQKAIYLQTPWFCARAAVIFAIWLVMIILLRRWSLQQDAEREPGPTIRMRTLSGPGIVIYPLTATFGFVDWVMAIEPRWYSTIYLVILLAGQFLAGFAFITVLVGWLRNEAPFRNVVTRQHFHDLGNLLLAFVIFWTYVSFSQLLIIYSGDLPREIDWYLHRIAGGWKWVVGVLALFNFFVPFFLLLFRVMNQNIRRLAVIAWLILAAHLVETFWLIEPAYFSQGFHLHWLDFAAVAGVGGIWLIVFATVLRQSALLPRNDPRMEMSLQTVANAQ